MRWFNLFFLESDVILLYSSNNYLTYFQNTDNQIEIISVHCDLFIFFHTFRAW